MRTISIIAFVAAAFLAGCTQNGANPRVVPPDITTEFPGDFRKMAECLYDKSSEARLTWLMNGEKAEVAVYRLTGDYLVSWIVQNIDDRSFRVDYRVLGFMGKESPLTQTCAALSV